jgi:hypothetical protein
MSAAEMPVFCGVGGGITGGIRVVNLAQHAEFQGGDRGCCQCAHAE